MQKSLLLSALAAVVVAAPAAAQQPTTGTPTPAAPTLPAPDTARTLPPAADTVVKEAAGEIESSAAASDVLAAAKSAGTFTIFLKAVETAGLADSLRSAENVTIFAPTDEAFAKLPAGQLDSLLANPEQLRNVVLNHVVTSKVTTADAASQPSATTAAGESLAIAQKDGQLTVGAATVTQADIASAKGVVHAIDTVLLPGAASAAPPAAAPAPAADTSATPTPATSTPATPAPTTPAPATPAPTTPPAPATGSSVPPAAR